MSTSPERGSPLDQRVTLLRIIATIVAMLVAYQSLTAITHPAPDTPAAGWNAIPLGLAAAALALFWQPRPRWMAAILTLFAAIAVQAFTVFGDSAFARTTVSAILSVLAAFFTWAYLIVPIVTWRRGRWSVSELTFERAGDGEGWPAPVRRRVEALAALGFVPRLVHARAEGGAAATLVFLLDASRGILATVTCIDFNARVFLSTRITPFDEPPASRLSVVDVQPPDPLPAPPGHRVLLFPDAPAATLVQHFLQAWQPRRPATAPSDDELAAKLQASLADRERWLIEQGYLAPSATAEHRYTLKGAFTTMYRMLWPMSSLERARLLRNGQEALGGAPGGARR